MMSEGGMRIREVVMKHSGAILTGSAALLLMGVAGCYSQRSNQSAQQGSAGSAHLQTIAFNGTYKAEVKDPGNGSTAFTVDVPSGWKFAGAILRPRGCHAPATAGDGLSFTELAPDGVTSLGQTPGVSWDWASDGTSPQGPKCQPIGITTAAGFLLNIAVPNMHPYAKILGILPLTPQMQQGLDAQRRNLQSNNQARVTLDTARVRVEYALGGRIVDEQLGVVINCRETNFPAYPQMRRPARTVRTCTSHGTYIKRAPKGQLDALVANSLPGPQIDHAWDEHIQQQMLQNFAAYEHANDVLFASIQQHYKQLTASMVQHGVDVQNSIKASTDSAMAADSARQGAIDHAAHQQQLDSLNRADFVDPTTGQKIETSNQFNHNWISTDGRTVVVGDNPNFDPNGVVNPNQESFIQLIPAP
jgi:hypothetical protein